MKKIALLSVVGVGALAAVAAAAQQSKGTEHVAKAVECNQQADAKDFGIHEYQRHRFVIRCIAGLLQY